MFYLQNLASANKKTCSFDYTFTLYRTQNGVGGTQAHYCPDTRAKAFSMSQRVV